MLIVGAIGEIDIVTAIDGRCRFLCWGFESGYLIDSRIVTHHHAVEAEIAPQDVGEYLVIGHTVCTVHSMIAGHEGFAARQTYHRLVRQEYLFHQFFLVGIASTAVTKVVFRAGADAFVQSPMLQSTHKGRTHHGREIAVLAIGLLQAVEARRAADVDHG